MPFIGGVAGALSVGAKTWRPRSNEEAFLEAEQKRATEAEQVKRRALQQKIQTLENVRKIEAKTQALNEMAMAAEIRGQEHEVAMKERQLAEARRAELAKLELAKRLGRESLSEADLARIRRERMKTELLAKAAGNHAIQEHMRPVNPITIDLGPPSRMPLPPPLPHHMPVPSRVPSAASHHHHHHISPPSMMTPMPMPRPPIPMPMPPAPHYHQHRRVPSEPGIRMRRMSGGMLPGGMVPPPPPSLAGAGRGQWGLPGNALRGTNVPAHFDRPHSARPTDSRLRHANLRRLREDSLAQLALRAQAERLRRRRLEKLDLKARQLNLKAQALRDLRKRELMVDLRARGLQQREIDSQVRLMNERERDMTEAQLRDLRDREHRLLLKDKGLQEREVLEQIRVREERDREVLRSELERLERELRRAELMDAEIAIKHAYDKGQSPPLGVLRPSIDEIENEGLLIEDFYDEFEGLDPRIRAEILAETGLSPDMYPGSRASASIGQRTPNPEHHRTPSMGARTPLMRGISPGQIRDESNRIAEENMMREEALMRPTEGMLGDRLNVNNHHHQPGMQRQRSQSFDRRSPNIQNNIRAALREEAESREREEIGRLQASQDSSFRHRAEEQNRMGINQTPLSQHRRTPSMRDNLEASYNDSTRNLDLPLRSASRASSRGPGLSEFEDIPRSISRSGSIRDGYSPAGGLGPSRPASRNLTVDDLGLGLAARLRTSSREREREPQQYSNNDDLLSARLHSAQVNSQYNGGTRSRANSRAERVDPELLRSARAGQQGSSGLDIGGMSSGRRSRANSRAELPSDELLRSASRNQQQLGAELGLGSTSGRRSRASSVSHVGYGAPSRSPRPSEFSEFALQEETLRARESRRNLSAAGSPQHGYSDAGWGSLTSEELRQLSTDQLEGLLLSEAGGDINYSSLPHLSEDEVAQLTSEQLDALYNGGGTGASLSGRRSISRGPSRASGLGDSPPFGTGIDLQQQARSRSRNEYANNTGPTNNSRYSSSRAPSPNFGAGPSSGSSLYNMPGHFEPEPDQVETGAFVITDEYEHPNTKIVESLGHVQADNLGPNSSGIGGGGLAGPDANHLAVNNLITKASRMGANGVIGLRVMDTPDGRYVAQGEAVVLASKF